jgi:hypothetical protein
MQHYQISQCQKEKPNTTMNIKLLMKQAIIILIALGSLSLAGCKKGWWDSEEGGNGKLGSGKQTVKGTMVSVLCGISIYNDLWIKTDDGTLLQPCKQTVDNIVQLAEGDRVEIQYSIFNGKSELDERVICMAALPPHKRVTINYIAKISSKNSCTPLIIIPNGGNHGDIKNKSIFINSAKMNGSCLEINISYSGCNNHSKNIQLIGNGELSPYYGQPTYLVELVDTKPQMCEALFTDQVAYNMSALKAEKGTYYIKIDGYDELIAITK